MEVVLWDEVVDPVLSRFAIVGMAILLLLSIPIFFLIQNFIYFITLYICVISFFSGFLVVLSKLKRFKMKSYWSHLVEDIPYNEVINAVQRALITAGVYIDKMNGKKEGSTGSFMSFLLKEEKCSLEVEEISLETHKIIEVRIKQKEPNASKRITEIRNLIGEAIYAK